MAEFLAELLDCDASYRVLTATDLSEWEPPSKKRKRGKFSSENEGGVDDGRSNDDGWMSDDSKIEDLVHALLSGLSDSENEGGVDDGRSNDDGWMLDDSELEDLVHALLSGLSDSENEGGVDDGRSNDDGWMSDDSELEDWVHALLLGPSDSENEGGVDDGRSNDDGWMPDEPHELGQLALFPMELEPPFSGKSSSENKGRLDDRRSNGDIWMTNEAGLLSPPPPHSLSLDLRLGTCDSQISIQNWNKLESNGSLDREDNHDNGASSENEDRLLNCRSYDDLPLKLTLPVSSTEIGKESNEINGVEGSCEVHPVAGKCPVRRPNAVQLLSASSSNSDCLDVNLRMEGRHPPPLLLWLRDMFSQPYHHRPAGTIFGNLKPENVLMMTDRLFCGQLSYIKKNNMDPFLVKSTPEAEGLFLRLLKKNPELSRLGEKEVLLHPFSWSLKDKLHFLHQMREMLASENLELDADLLEELESNEPPVFDGNWIDKLDPIFKDYILKRPENYDYSSVLGLVRCIRNNGIHLPRLPRKIKKKVGWNDVDFYIYFVVRFPSLLMKLYGVASQFCREERWFKEFHEEIFRELFGRDAP